MFTRTKTPNVRGHAKFMGHTGPVQIGYGARTFFTHINNGGGTLFRKHVYEVSKTVAEFNKVFNFEKFLIYV